MKILMVCLGNICRSPMADGIMNHKAQEYDLNIEVDSAGTSAYHIGEAPDKRQQATALERGIDISDLRARQFVQSDYDEFDLIYAMDESNYNNMLALSRNDSDREKVKMILNESYPGKNMSVPDPYYGGDQGFIHVYELLNDACEVVAQKIMNGEYR